MKLTKEEASRLSQRLLGISTNSIPTNIPSARSLYTKQKNLGYFKSIIRTLKSLVKEFPDDLDENYLKSILLDFNKNSVNALFNSLAGIINKYIPNSKVKYQDYAA